MGFTKSMFIFGTAKEGDSFEFLFPYEGDQPILGYKPWCNCISEVKVTERGIEGVIKPEFANEQQDGQQFHEYRRSLSVYIDDGKPYWSFDTDGKLTERQPVFLNIQGYLDMNSKKD